MHSTDEELATSLKNELKFDADRRNNFRKHQSDKKVYDRERDKGLALQLEEQERWDILREQGAKEQRKLRAQAKNMDEEGPEYKQDLKQKKAYETQMEASRKRHIQTKKTLSDEFLKNVKNSEEVELDLASDRPRFDRRKRHVNKWAKSGASGSSGYSDPGGSGPAAPAFDYPPVPTTQDYMPVDNFDEIPPPPPLNSFEGGGNPGGYQDPYYNEGGEYGAPPGYPPPPPPDGWDF